MESTSNLSPDLVTRSVNFHGQLLQKTWEAERGEGDLQKQGISNLDYDVYSQRQKHLSFQDRGKRLKLHQFISKRADILFDPSLVERQEPKPGPSEPGLFAVMPSFENFLNLDKSSRSQHFLQCLRVGDVIISSISNKANSGLFLKVLCLDGDNGRSVSDLNIKAFCPTSNLISAIDKKNVPRTFMLNDLVACEVLEVIPDSEKIMCGMKGIHSSEHKKQLGLFHSDDFPESYKLALEGKTDTYEAMLEKSLGFHNPSNVSCLSDQMGLGNLHHTNVLGLKGRFPEAEYANELRQVQAGRWALKSVTEGVDHFKAGRKTEAFQCLNRALTIDPNNIEAIVARGALYANSGSFKKAVEDFEYALKMNSTHGNARQYMSETLVAYGRSYEDASQYEEALKCYEKCLEITPYHEEALSSCEFMRAKIAKTKNGGSSLTDGLVTGLSITKAQGVKDTLKQLLGNEQSSHKDEPSSAKKKKKEKKNKKHKRSHSSSSSDSSSSGSSSSSSSSSSSDSSSASSNDSGKKKKHKSRKSEPKEKSLSPLSKRMAIMDSSASAIAEGQRASHYNPPALPFSFQSEQVSAAAAYPTSNKSDKESEYEQRVCKFLEQTKGDSDYEEKVRKFLDETAKWKKERKAYEEKAKKKRKKEKKASKKNKKKKREERKKKKMMKEIEDSKKIRDALRKQRRRSLLDEDEDFMYSDKTDLRLSLPALEDLQSKLSYFVKAEKGSSKKKEKSVEKLVAAAQMKAKASSPKKVLYLPEDEEEEETDTRGRKSVDQKKKMDMFEVPSPPRMPDAKNVPLPSAPPPPASKFKMNIGPGQNRLKKPRDKSNEKDNWDSDGDKRFMYMSERERMNDSMPSKEPENKKPAEKKVEEQLAKTPMVLDKLGGFRINTFNAEKLAESEKAGPLKRKLRSRVSDSDSSDSDAAAKKKERPRSPGSSRSRSRSRSHKKYSSDSPPPKKYSSSSSRSPSYRKDRSRSKSGSYRSRSGRRYRSSESGSYRSRSRSRSRSMDYHRRSRSRSDDRHHYRKYPGHYPRNRGTYYRPRFQTGFKTRPGGFFPRGRGPWRPGGRPFIPRMRGRGRPRFFHNNYKPRDDRYRRYERDMSRSDDDDGSPMRKVDAAKERIDRMLGENKRHSGPLSEGEERDEDYIERKDYNRDRSASPEGKKEAAKDGKKPNPW